jgi:tripartite-type tricarboxylate transporter receptor subunit TctC
MAKAVARLLAPAALVSPGGGNMMPLIRITGLVGLVVFLSAAASAEPVEDFFRSKTINLVIGHWAGSANDLYARALARHMSRHIPGHPTLVPQNMPGAGSLKAANWIYAAAPEDGTALAMFTSAALFEPMLGNKAAQFDPQKYSWIGNMDESVATCIVSQKSNIRTFEDLKKREVLFGSTSATSDTAQFAVALRKITGAKIKVVHGYEGAADIPLAMQRGEVEGDCAVSLSLLKTKYADDMTSGLIRPIVQFTRKPHPELPGVADIYDYAKSDEDRQVFDLVFGRQEIGRPVLGPPGIPADRLKALRTAFMATMKDPEFLADARQMKMEIAPSTGAEVEEWLGRLLSAPKEAIAKAEAITRDQ